MDKTLCCNNLDTVGKWVSFLFGVAVAVFILVPIASQSRILDFLRIGRGSPFVYAYVSDVIPTSSYQPAELKLDLNPLDSVGQINDITLPVNDLINEAIKGLRFDQVINIGTGIPLSPIKSPSQNIDFDFNRFFSSSRVTPNDLTSFLKEAAITGINLSLLIISITTQVLKGLLNVLK